MSIKKKAVVVGLTMSLLGSPLVGNMPLFQWLSPSVVQASSLDVVSGSATTVEVGQSVIFRYTTAKAGNQWGVKAFIGFNPSRPTNVDISHTIDTPNGSYNPIDTTLQTTYAGYRIYVTTGASVTRNTTHYFKFTPQAGSEGQTINFTVFTKNGSSFSGSGGSLESDAPRQSSSIKVVAASQNQVTPVDLLLINEPSSLLVDQEHSFQAQINANGNTGTILGNLVITDQSTGSELDPSLYELTVDDGTGNYVSFPVGAGNYFGSPAGFPLKDDTLNFKIKMKGGSENKTINYTVKIVEQGDTSKTIASTNGSFTVYTDNLEQGKQVAKDDLATELDRYNPADCPDYDEIEDIYDQAIIDIDNATTQVEIDSIVAQAKTDMENAGSTCSVVAPPANPPANNNQDESDNHSSGGSAFSMPEAPQCADLRPQGQVDLFQIDSIQDKATLYWTPAEGSGYAIFYKRGNSEWDSGDRHGVVVDYNNRDGVNQFTINDLLDWSDYDFRVVPLNGCATGNPSNELATHYRGKKPNQVTVYYK